MNRQEATEVAKDYLTSYVETLTEHSPKGNRKAYVCPLCGSGNGRSKTGAFTITPDGHSWKCFSGEKGGDTLDLIGYVEDITDYNTKIQRAGELFNLDIETSTEYQKQGKNAQNTDTRMSIHTEIKAQTNYITFYQEAHKHIKETDDPNKRGLSDSLLERFKIGYVAEWKHLNGLQYFETLRNFGVIPLS